MGTTVGEPLLLYAKNTGVLGPFLNPVYWQRFPREQRFDQLLKFES